MASTLITPLKFFKPEIEPGNYRIQQYACAFTPMGNGRVFLCSLNSPGKNFQ